MKTASRILLSLGLVVFLTGTVFSQGASTSVPAKTQTDQTAAAPGKFVDANANGICDHHETKAACGQGKKFVDKNGDGKCDNCVSTGNCKGSGCGKGQKQGCGKGQGKGNCCGAGQGQGNGCGQGRQHQGGCKMQGSTTTPQSTK